MGGGLAIVAAYDFAEERSSFAYDFKMLNFGIVVGRQTSAYVKWWRRNLPFLKATYILD